MENARIIAGIVGALVAPVFEFFYGEGTLVMSFMTAFLFFLALDWMSGIRASKKDESYASEYGIDGIYRSIILVALPAGGHLLDKAVGSPGVIFGLFCVGLLYHIIQSFLANCIRAGWGRFLPMWVLEPIMAWVKSEVEAKLARATERKQRVETILKEEGDRK